MGEFPQFLNAVSFGLEMWRLPAVYVGTLGGTEEVSCRKP